MSPHATRRSIIAGTGIAAVLAAMPIAAPALPMSNIEKHWRDRCIAYREFEADPEALNDSERANDYWDRIDAAEVAILNSPDTSNRAAELRMWVAWSHCDETNRTAVAQADVPALRGIHASLDWHEKLIFAAILHLRGEG